MEITTQNLAKRFNREWIFRKFDYTFKSGETYALTGPNGSGKSTLLQVLWGQVPPSNGTLLYKNNGAEVRPEDFYNYLSIATPYMDLIDELTLAEQLQFHFKLKASRNNLTIDEMIERMYLTPARDKFIVNFSSGMRQRVKLGLAFFTQADIIFLDEPGTNLDKTAFDWYLGQLDTLPKECMIVIASNQPSEYPASAHKIDITRYK